MQALRKTLLLLILIGSVEALLAQSALPVVILAGKNMNDRHLADVRIFVRSARGFLIGNSMQEFAGIWITDPIEPPSGVELTKTPVPWSDISKVQWDENVLATRDRYAKAKLTMKSGAVKEVFLWIAQREPYYTPLVPPDMRIAGKMRMSDKDVDVEVTDGSFTTLTIKR